MQLPRKILVATNNSGKFVEISDLLQQINIEAVKVSADIAEPAETGTDFAANSLEALNGAPGIYSARFALDESGQKNFPYAFEKIFTSLKENGAEPCGSKAHFICNLTIFDPQTNFSISFEGRIDGMLTFPARGNQGFGYDPIFVKNGMAETFGEISASEKDAISHRAEAFRQLINYFSSSSR